MRSFLAAALILAGGRHALAQRPSDSTICDYYATVRYGDNSTTHQFQLIQNIVALAFGGGAGVKGASEKSTGILNPGTFEGQPVYLRSWFDGSSRCLAAVRQLVRAWTEGC